MLLFVSNNFVLFFIWLGILLFEKMIRRVEGGLEVGRKWEVEYMIDRRRIGEIEIIE